MEEQMEQYIRVFIDQAKDLISELEKLISKLKKDTKDFEIITKIINIVHSLKGVSGMFGYRIIGFYSQKLELLYNMVRSNEVEISDELIEVTIKSVIHLRNLLNDPMLKNKEIESNHYKLLERINFLNNYCFK
ncbi:MAG: Hpt domain-containing protein [Bacteroidota bacterium]|nr:Hpt domain-containing protein [Bacteroidota bacterium]